MCEPGSFICVVCDGAGDGCGFCSGTGFVEGCPSGWGEDPSDVSGCIRRRDHAGLHVDRFGFTWGPSGGPEASPTAARFLSAEEAR